MRLLDFKRDVNSQAGEDGILAKILEILPKKDEWCVEFGAWDGKEFSNTCDLLDSAGYSGVMIEFDDAKFQDLLKQHGANKKVICMKAMVGFTADDSLDHLLAQTPIPQDFDVLSIDIDGNDYNVWKAVTRYTPKVVLIEFNPTMPLTYEYVQRADIHVSEGSSLLSLVKLGKAKGYELVAVTRFNGIFVRAEYFPLFDIADNSIQALMEDTCKFTYLVTTYDGKISVVGNPTMPWHFVRYAQLVAQLPKGLQSYPPFYSKPQKFFLKKFKSFLKRWRPGREAEGGKLFLDK